MFKIDQTSNHITCIESRRFSELGFSKRNHQQEWFVRKLNVIGVKDA